MEKKRKTEKIDTVGELKDASLKKNAAITAKKIVKKYKSMKRPKTYLVDEKDLETIDYNEPQEDLLKGESIISAVNKVFDFEKFIKDQADGLKNPLVHQKKYYPNS